MHLLCCMALRCVVLPCFEVALVSNSIRLYVQLMLMLIEWYGQPRRNHDAPKQLPTLLRLVRLPTMPKMPRIAMIASRPTMPKKPRTPIKTGGGNAALGLELVPGL